MPPTAQPAPGRRSFVDALLLLMTLIWGTNYSIVKRAFTEIHPQAFNAMRMMIASSLFLVTILILNRSRRSAAAEVNSVFYTPAPLTACDWLVLTGLGAVGHALYQYLFVGGLALTSVANSSLMLAATPVVIAIVSAFMGRERVGPLHWLGAALSLTGIYIVVAHGVSGTQSSMRGDLMIVGAVCCWTAYTLGAGPLMKRHSPVGVTGLSMAIGTLVYVPIMLPKVRAIDWLSVSSATWIAILYSAIFALAVAYTIWYMAVREIGSARTAVYSNLIPIVAMLTAVVFLGERLTQSRLAGAAAVLVGVALTRVRTDLLKLQ